MKKVFAIVVLLVIVTAGVAMASATNWLTYIQVSNPTDTDAGVYNQIGVKPAATDGVDSVDLAAFYLASTIKTASQQIAGSTTTAYDRNFLSTAAYTTYPASKKIWSFRVAGLSAASTATGIKMIFKTGPSAVKNPDAVAGVWEWRLKLVNARLRSIVKPSWAGGGAWAEDTYVVLTIPTTTATLFGQVNLPTINLSVDDNAHMLSEGYEFEFQQAVIPEPSSLLVLGTGLAGLIGLVSRRRRV